VASPSHGQEVKRIPIEKIFRRLPLSNEDKTFFKKESYTPELLYQTLREVHPNTLQKIYDHQPANIKLQAVIDALVRARIVTEEAVQIAAGVASLFSEDAT
jgi:hypothetical protein